MSDQLLKDSVTIAKSEIDWAQLDGKTVLIAGACGYVPQYFVHGLLKHNDLFHTKIGVIALCRNENKALERFSQYTNRDDFKIVIKDITEYTDAEMKIDYIIHAASPASMKTRYVEPTSIFRSNVIGADNLLNIATKNNSVFLYISSVDVYGKIESSDRLREDKTGILDPLGERNVYSCSKRSVETMCYCYSRAGIQTKIVRPFQILGGGIQLDDGRLHADFISQLLKSDEIILKGDGTPVRSFMYVTDAIEAMLQVMLKGESGQAYNVCSEDNEASVLELANIMCSIKKGNQTVKYDMIARKSDPNVKHALSIVCGSSDKIRELGWNPHYSLRDSCRMMMRYYFNDNELTE